MTGTLFPIEYNIKCKICKKNKAVYEHITPSNYYYLCKPTICNQCLSICIKYANEFLFDLSLPSLFKLYCEYRQTIAKYLVNDINYKIFWLTL